ncbi:Uncharacterised protein [Legionella lansingensis]|uniref:Uncharacterized protein n=1 Tax=Legionella lansingensis TaxID=45067 RepID=A0A0W0VRH2_9GAMM|nr:hypothetical protein [Legionella lansingensis]KTD22754.1 hypothetical protein Llan_1105 [Legionella lansingensis]SNV56901.1 Uncharacterised protein [Legionella lansingensis]
MGQFKVSTFGKWESQRKQLVQDLLADKQLGELNEKQVDDVLLNDVNSAMVTAAFAYIKEEKQKSTSIPMRELTISSYRVSLNVMLNSLAHSLKLSPTLLAPHVEKFRHDAEQSLPEIIDDMMQIGAISVNTKAKAMDELYGNDFKTKFPQLAQQLPFEDSELIKLAREKIEAFFLTHDFGKNETLMRSHLVYITEIAAQMMPASDFVKQFQEQTGQSMEEYKAAHKMQVKNEEKILSAVTPFWKTPQPETKTESSSNIYQP